MGCSQTNVVDKKKLNVPKSDAQESKHKNIDENKTKNEDKKIKEDKALFINKSKQFVKEEIKAHEEIKKDDKNIIKPPPINKEEIKKDDTNIKKESDNKNKAHEETKKDDEKKSKEKESKKEETEKLNENKKNIEINPVNIDTKETNKNNEEKKVEDNKNIPSATNKEEKNNLDEIKKDDKNIIKPPPINKEDPKKENEKNKKPVPKKDEIKPNSQKKEEKKLPLDKTNKNTNTNTNTKKNEIDIVIDVTKGGRQFISDNFEGDHSDYNEEEEEKEEEDDENKQYTKSKVEIYIDNKKTKFTRSISEKEFPEEKVYHIKLKFKVLFKNCVGMFVDCGVTSIDLSNFDMSKVENMQAMFNSCSNLTSVKFPNANTVNLTNMNYMFSFCDNLTSVNITSLNTKNVEYMNSIFSRCKKLKNLDLSNLDIGKVKDKGLIFYNCYHETSFKLPKGIIKGNVKIIFYCLPYDSFFHEEFVKNNKNKIQLIFKNKEYKLCGSIREIDKDFKDNTIDVKLKVIGALTNLSYMFSGSEISYLGDISKLDTSKVTDMSYLFYENKFVHFDDGFAINWDTSNVKLSF